MIAHGDADHLAQLLLILLDSAVKCTPPPGEVTLTTQTNGGQARISVTDTGLGIPDTDTQRIFERFYRGRNAGTTTGTGLGLAIANWIVDQHHGRIDVHTSANGTRFTVTLPLAGTRT
ncbi:sensor histidine kinase [Actinokineospora sp.]|uniref:sensor histidine kinase n=1 Tax=Actinokineospora sp. TaxID=1872133 RepID=UPI003D6A8AD3